MKEKRECKIVQDLLPNYIEGLTNEETNVFIEGHFEECSECKEILKNMQQDLTLDKPNKDSREVKYIKKYSKKTKLLKAIIFIILAVVIITTGRKMIIISNLSKKANQYVVSDNYYMEKTTYHGDGLTNTKLYYKDEKTVTISQSIIEDEITKMTIYNNGQTINTYWCTEEGKKAEINQEIAPENRILNYLQTDNFFELLISSIGTKITETNCNGKECYLLNEFSIPGEWVQEVLYIDKETGLVIRNSESILIDANDRKTSEINDFYYEFGKVTDEIFKEPDISEYTIINE